MVARLENKKGRAEMIEKSEEDVAGEVHDLARMLLEETQDRLALYQESGRAVPAELLTEYQNRQRAAKMAWERYHALSSKAMAKELAELPLKLQRQ